MYIYQSIPEASSVGVASDRQPLFGSWPSERYMIICTLADSSVGTGTGCGGLRCIHFAMERWHPWHETEVVRSML